MILDGKQTALEIREELKNEISKMTIKPKLVVMLVGNDFGSQKYVASKAKVANEIGMVEETIVYDEETSEDIILSKIE